MRASADLGLLARPSADPRVLRTRSPMLWLKGVAQAEQRYFPESASEDGAATLLVRLRGVLRADGGF